MNAIILAAGMGSRFKEIGQKTHKSLLPVEGVPNLERTVLYLQQAGIHDICIVVGHLAEQFDFLKEKYGCKLIYNPKYREYNSIYSFYLASSFFTDSYVIDCDVVLFKNIFQEPLSGSHYFLIPRPLSEEKEWLAEINNNRITQIEVSNKPGYSLLGISYWDKKESQKILEKLPDYMSLEILENSKLYWDNIPLEILSTLEVKPYLLQLKDGFEMDNMDNYNFILNNLTD